MGMGESQGIASAFHTGHFPKGHGPTNFSAWFESSSGYDVSYADFSDPYVVAAKTRIPRYDERFRGYGINKVKIRVWYILEILKRGRKRNQNCT